MSLVIRILKYLLLVCLLYASWLMLQLTLPYVSMQPHVDFLKTKELIYHITHWRASFYIHVFTGLFVLVAGILQFNRYIIRNHKRLHRTAGYVYIIDVLFITGPAALVMAFYANGGIPARISFVMLAILWLGTTALAWYRAVKKRFSDHGAWMLRSYALTLSAITLRTYAWLFGYFNIPLHPVQTYTTISWLSWTLNLIVAEIMIRKGFIRYLLKGNTGNDA